MSQERFTLVSMFCGCGGGDLGFRGDFHFLGQYYPPLPFDLVWANDLDPFAWKVHLHNFRTPGTQGDIGNIDFNSPEFLSTSVDVILAGFPCQDFALLGPRGGLASRRGRLYREIRRALVALQPKVFLAENVPGIEHPPSVLKAITRHLAGRGVPRYRVTCHRINAADYGVPQTRNRILIVGIRSDITEEFQPPPPVRESPSSNPNHLPSWRTTQEGIEDLWLSAPLVPDQDKVTKATIVLAPAKRKDCRLRPDSVAPTIRAEHHGHVEVHYHAQSDGSLRRLSVRECARLQGFPDTFTFPVSFTQAYRQIGNAMPPVMIHHWANAIARWLDETSTLASERLTAHRDAAVTSRIMASVKNKGSKAERALGRAMWSLGLRYRKHPNRVPGRPDYAFVAQKIAVFCDGDFWHGLSWKDRGFNSWEEQFEHMNNAEFWREKITRNMLRDQQVNQQLSQTGWKVIRIRETKILEDPERYATLIRQELTQAINATSRNSSPCGHRLRENAVGIQIH